MIDPSSSTTTTTTSATANSSNALARRTKSARRSSERRRISEEGLGVWTRVEHERFLEGKRLFPDGPWKLVAEYVGTRNTRQTMTHAQKYRQKLERRQRGLRTTRRASDNDDDLLLVPELYYTSSPHASAVAASARTLDAATSASPLHAASSPMPAPLTTTCGTFEQLLMGDTLRHDVNGANALGSYACASPSIEAATGSTKVTPSVDASSPTHHADAELPWLDECLDYLILNLL